MDDMNVFGRTTDDSAIGYDAYSRKLGDLKILDHLLSSSSDGELLKWQVMNKKGEIWWLKSSSVINGKEMYECESECIACRIARELKMKNVKVVGYNMDILEVGGKKYKVCSSKDFVMDSDFTTFAELVPDAVKLYEREKYEYVCEKLPDYVQQLNQILIFDAIIYNKDRHLNNLALVDGEMVLFDNGASMFGRDTSAKIAYSASSFKYQSCKPFYSTVGNQLALVNDAFSDIFLDRINIDYIKEYVNKLLGSKRGKWVIKLLERNLVEVERFGNKEI